MFGHSRATQILFRYLHPCQLWKQSVNIGASSPQSQRSVAQGMRTVDLAHATTRLADDSQMSLASMEQTITDQERAIAGMQFKFS